MRCPLGKVAGKFGIKDAAAATLVALSAWAIFAYRAHFIEPRAWGAICRAATPPLACAPRTALLWMQQHYLWGALALALGLAAFLLRPRTPLCAAAIIAGIAAVANYNATWGMLGAALGAWAWLRVG